MPENAERDWTKEQLAAIDARRSNLLVAAAAGAGKTAVLVERIIRRLTDAEAPVSLENMLVVTFTDAAAAEMRQRIGAALEEAVARQPENEGLRRQLLLLNRAPISTIHAFCLRVLRTYFYRLDLDPAFRVLDPAEADLMQLEVMDRVLEECFAAEPGGGPVTDLADSLGGRADAGLVDQVLKVWRFTRSLPWPDAWLEKAVAAYRIPASTPLEALPWYREIKEIVALRLQEAAFYLRQARAVAAGPGGPATYLDNLKREEDQVAGLLAGMDDLSWEGLWERLRGIGFEKLKPVRGDSVDAVLKEKAAGYRDQAKKLIRNLQEEFYRDEAAVRAELERAGETVAALVELVRRFDAAYREQKRRHSLVDFGDLEHLCLQVLLDPQARSGELRPSEVALELRRRFEEVLVDEYQDINSIQDAILTLVSRQGVLAPVQDPARTRTGSPLPRPENPGAGEGFPATTSGDIEPALAGRQPVCREASPLPFLTLAGPSPASNLPTGRQAPDSFTSLLPGPQLADLAPNLFMVGDVKQSIYRFRLANPELFLEKYRTYPEREGEASRRILLKANFRSRQGIVAGVNFVFRQVFSRLVGELEYDAGAALVGRAAYPEHPAAVAPHIEVYLLEGQPEGNAGSEPGSAGVEEDGGAPGAAPGAIDLEDLTALEREAWLVARRIRQLVQGTPERSGPECQVWDGEKKAYRDITYRDIVILLRATKDRAPVFLEALQQCGVPAYADLGSGYFAATEVETILSLLRIIDNPRQDIPLAAVLRSPLVGLTAGELARIRLAAPGEDFYTAVVKVAAKGPRASAAPGATMDAIFPGPRTGDGGRGESAVPEADAGDPFPGPAIRNPATPGNGRTLTGAGSGQAEAGPTGDLAGRLGEFLARLERWRTMARRQPLGDVIWQLYRETGYLEFAGGLPGGAQRQANLRALLDRARQFEGFARHGLFRFLRFIERLQQNEGDLGPARALGENEDVVRVMSIHKAKGLEFPVVIVADLGHQFNLRDISGEVLLHSRLGLAPLYFDATAGVKYPTLTYLAVTHRLRLEALSEEARILYVALTRAREKLILTGTARDLPRRATNWCAGLAYPEEQLPPMLVARGVSHLDWLAAALARHPAGAAIRDLAGVKGGFVDDPSSWQLEIVSGPVAPGHALPVDPPLSCHFPHLFGQEPVTGGQMPPSGEARKMAGIRGLQSGTGALEEPAEEDGYARLKQEVARRLAWTYSWQPLAVLPVKMAVTDLKRRFDVFNEDDAPLRPGYNGFTRRPLFLQGQRDLTAAERGTATHLVLQHVNLSRPVTAAGLAELLQQMVEREVLTPAQAAAVDAGAITAFFAGPLGQRLLARPGRVQRELPFSLAVPAGELYPELPPAIATGEVILVQGIIDCLVEEEDGFLLVDFKTGKVPPDPLAAYRVQVRFYTRAVETIFDRPVKEAYLYFLDGAQGCRVI